MEDVQPFAFLPTLSAAEQALEQRVVEMAGLPPKRAREGLSDLFERALECAPARSGHPSPPLVLISQVQRSGGTLLSQSFDGHPEVLAYPHELKIGFPKKWHWPALRPSEAPLVQLTKLFNVGLLRMVRDGYRKGGSNPHALTESHPFTLHLATLCHVLVQRAEAARSAREVLDAYFSAFFAAWREAPSTGREKWVVAFCPRLLFEGDSAERFFETYPDGRLISCIREPASWWVSAAAHDEAFHDLGAALAGWAASAAAGRDLRRQRPGSVALVRYETLALAHRATMGRLAAWLGIDPRAPSLATPTYAGRPVRPNSSFSVEGVGVHRDGVDRTIHLPPDIRETIRRGTAQHLDGLEAETV